MLIGSNISIQKSSNELKVEFNNNVTCLPH